MSIKLQGKEFNYKELKKYIDNGTIDTIYKFVKEQGGKFINKCVTCKETHETNNKEIGSAYCKKCLKNLEK